MNIPSTNLLHELENWANREDMIGVLSNLKDMVTKNDLYLEETLNGKIGKIEKFWMNFAKIRWLIQLMQGSVRINVTALYSFALFKETSIFFMTNHHD